MMHVVYEFDKCSVAVLPVGGRVHEQSAAAPCDHLNFTIRGTGTDFP